MLVSVSGACANSRASAPHFTFLALDLVSHFTFSALDLVSTLSSVLHSYSFRSFAVSMPGNAEVGKWSPEQNGAPMAHTDKGQCTIAVLERHLLAPAIAPFSHTIGPYADDGGLDGGGQHRRLRRR
jgi:hypothetical protein